MFILNIDVDDPLILPAMVTRRFCNRSAIELYKPPPQITYTPP
jgi:hypothetical protein